MPEMSFADRCLSNAWDEAQAENESRRRSEYVKCTCLWHETYPDERMVGNTDCPAHGDDVDGSMHDLPVAEKALEHVRELHIPIVYGPDITDETWVECKSCRAEEWPCATAQLVYSSEEIAAL